MLIAVRSEVPGAEPGLQSLATAMAAPGRAQRRDRRRPIGREAIERHRQQHRHRAGARERRGFRFAGVLQVIARERAVARRQQRAAEVSELLGVHLDRHPERVRRREQPLGLRNAEGDALAEHIHGIHQSLARAAPAATRAAMVSM